MPLSLPRALFCTVTWLFVLVSSPQSCCFQLYSANRDYSFTKNRYCSVKLQSLRYGGMHFFIHSLYSKQEISSFIPKQHRCKTIFFHPDRRYSFLSLRSVTDDSGIDGNCEAVSFKKQLRLNKLLSQCGSPAEVFQIVSFALEEGAGLNSVNLATALYRLSRTVFSTDRRLLESSADFKSLLALLDQEVCFLSCL